ncbi:putative ankyrin repeat protein RF_0381 [Haliotis asinina]|uniref:putative ankyrin repeat protein RF_0381 n=1 Tax=Haliotis asinina TaxID=109174 RepID=UPI0035327E4B
MSPLLQSVYYGKREVFDVLVEQGADLLALDTNGDSILHLACERGNTEMVNYILAQNFVDINAKGYKGRSPSLLSVYYGKMEVFEALVEQGADLSVVDKNGNNLLHLACLGGHVQMVKYILKQNLVHINAKEHRGMSPFLLSAYFGKREVFDVFVKQGADLSVVDKNGNNVLHLACRTGKKMMAEYILTQTTVDINSRNNRKMTPLLIAAYYGKIDVLGLLLEAGANALAADHNSNNMLHICCSRGHVDTVKYILNSSMVDINSKNSKGMTPVLIAAFWSEREILNILEKQGANLSITDGSGDNILHVACIGGDKRIVKHVLERHMVDINARGCDGMTAVLYAADCTTSDILKLLLENGADPFVVNDNGDSVLHMASAGGKENIVKFVLSQNIIDITTKNKQGKNATVIAKENGFLSITKLLSQGS